MNGQNPRKIWPLGQNPRIHFHGGGENPRLVLSLVFMDVFLFKKVKSVGISITFCTFIFHGMLLIFAFSIEGKCRSSLK